MRQWIDCHVHYAPMAPGALRAAVDASPYRNKYLLYGAVDETRADLSGTLNPDRPAFVIPFVFKETEIAGSNEALGAFAAQNADRAYVLPLMGEGAEAVLALPNAIGMKEHFLLHNPFACALRDRYYRLLNDSGKLLLLHCKDGVRLEYVKHLRQTYPNMIIQVAHLGVDRANPGITEALWKYFREDDRVYYDLSTVYDEGLLRRAFEIIPPGQLLFGTDIPYLKGTPGPEKFADLIARLLPEGQAEGVFSANAGALLNKLLK